MKKTNLKRKAYQHRVNADGVTVIHNMMALSYPMNQQDVFEHIGKLVDVYYDPSDLSKILISGHDFELIIEEYQPIPVRKTINS